MYFCKSLIILLLLTVCFEQPIWGSWASWASLKTEKNHIYSKIAGVAAKTLIELAVKHFYIIMSSSEPAISYMGNTQGRRSEPPKLTPDKNTSEEKSEDEELPTTPTDQQDQTLTPNSDPPDEPANYGPDFKAGYQFQYFNPEYFEDTLDLVSQLSEDLNTLLVLSFDIDGTVIQYESDLDVDDYNAFLKEQKYIAKIFKRWLEYGSGRARTLLVYNTSKLSRRYEDLKWASSSKRYGLPKGDIIIYGTGRGVAIIGKYTFEGIIDNYDSFTRNLIDLIEKQSTHFIEQDKLFHDKAGKDVDTIRSIIHETKEEMEFSNIPVHIHYRIKRHGDAGRYEQLKDLLNKLTLMPDITKYLYVFKEHHYLYFFDFHSNKGAALTILMKVLNSHIGYHTAQLFTAGNDISDASMIFMDQQFTTFWNIPDERSPAEDIDPQKLSFLEREYKNFGIDEHSLRYIQCQWRAGIIPNRIKPKFKYFLTEQQLFDHPNLLLVERGKYGLEGIFERIQERLQLIKSGAAPSCQRGASSL